MKRGILTCLAVLTLSMASSMSVLAAPEIMPDGGVFDAEYYAENNPDVVAVLGTYKDALYSHYVNNGRAEGRLGTAPVELTKADLVTDTAKRKQFEQECRMGNYGNIRDKMGNLFSPSDLAGFFNDAALEQFASFNDLIKFVESINLYKYAEEVTFASSYYYQDLKAKAVEDALAHVNNEYWQFHYQTREHKFSKQEYTTFLNNMWYLMQLYYGEAWGTGTFGKHYIKAPGYTLIDRFGETDGYCIEVGFYRSEEQMNMYHKGWILCSTC